MNKQNGSSLIEVTIAMIIFLLVPGLTACVVNLLIPMSLQKSCLQLLPVVINC